MKTQHSAGISFNIGNLVKCDLFPSQSSNEISRAVKAWELFVK